MIVDGSIVMVENIFRQVAARRRERSRVELVGLIRSASGEVARPIVFATGIIIAAYLPIFTLESTEGRIFGPMAWTVAGALLAAVILAVTVAPVLASYFFRRPMEERRNPLLEAVRGVYLPSLRRFLERPRLAAAIVALVLFADVVLYRSIGSEFLPHLNEGALTVHAELPASVSLDEARRPVDGIHQGGLNTPGIRDLLKAFPEVARTSVEMGRPDDGTDPSGLYNAEFNLFFKDRSQWRAEMKGSREVLEDAAVSGTAAAVVDIAGEDVAQARVLGDPPGPPKRRFRCGRGIEQLAVGMESREVQRDVGAEFLHTPGRELLELGIRVVAAGDEQGGDLQPARRFVRDVGQNVEHRLPPSTSWIRCRRFMSVEQCCRAP